MARFYVSSQTIWAMWYPIGGGNTIFLISCELARMICDYTQKYPDSKVHGANMRPTWVLSAPDGPRVGPINLAISADTKCMAAWPLLHLYTWVILIGARRQLGVLLNNDSHGEKLEFHLLYLKKSLDINVATYHRTFVKFIACLFNIRLII